MPPPPDMKMKPSRYCVYDEQYAYIDGVEKYRALLKDSHTGDFVGVILDDLKEEKLRGFFMRAPS